MRRRRKGLDSIEFALYRDDDFIAVGSLTEIAEIAGYDRKYLRWLTYPSAMKRGSSLSIIRLEED